MDSVHVLKYFVDSSTEVWDYFNIWTILSWIWPVLISIFIAFNTFHCICRPVSSQLYEEQICMLLLQSPLLQDTVVKNMIVLSTIYPQILCLGPLGCSAMSIKHHFHVADVCIPHDSSSDVLDGFTDLVVSTALQGGIPPWKVYLLNNYSGESALFLKMRAKFADKGSVMSMLLHIANADQVDLKVHILEHQSVSSTTPLTFNVLWDIVFAAKLEAVLFRYPRDIQLGVKVAEDTINFVEPCQQGEQENKIEENGHQQRREAARAGPFNLEQLHFVQGVTGATTDHLILSLLTGALARCGQIMSGALAGGSRHWWPWKSGRHFKAQERILCEVCRVCVCVFMCLCLISCLPCTSGCVCV